MRSNKVRTLWKTSIFLIFYYELRSAAAGHILVIAMLKNLFKSVFSDWGILEGFYWGRHINRNCFCAYDITDDTYELLNSQLLTYLVPTRDFFIFLCFKKVLITLLPTKKQKQNINRPRESDTTQNEENCFKLLQLFKIQITHLYY